MQRLFGAPAAAAPVRYAGASLSNAQAQTLNPRCRPEIALVGRSNVGKSSLLNALVKAPVARTSKVPGRTRMAHMFALGSDQAFLVDLPGYSYAVGSKDDVKSMSACVQEMALLRDPAALARVLVLCDARRSGLLEADWHMLQALAEARVRFDIVLTKTDKVDAAQQLAGEVGAQVLRELGAADVAVLPTSAKSGLGLAELRARILDIVRVAGAAAMTE